MQGLAATARSMGQGLAEAWAPADLVRLMAQAVADFEALPDEATRAEFVSEPALIGDEAWDAAIAAYKEVLSATPNDPIAKIGLLNVQLLKRMDGADFESLISSANDSIESQLAAADAEFLMNQLTESFTRLTELVRVNSGKDRELVRDRLIELFEIAGPTDPAVISGRTALANALF